MGTSKTRVEYTGREKGLDKIQGETYNFFQTRSQEKKGIPEHFSPETDDRFPF